MAILLSRLTQITKFSHSIALKNLVSRNFSLKVVKGQLLKPIVVNASFSRSFYDGEESEVERHFKIKDNVSDSYILIYRNGFPDHVLAAKAISTAIAVSLIGYIIYTDPSTTFMAKGMKLDYATVDKLLCLTGLITLTCLLQVASTKIPLRIYHHPQTKKYLMVVYETYLFKPKVKPFFAEDVKPAPITSLTPFPKAKFLVKGEVNYIIADFFRRPCYFNNMMGYDKPIDDDDDK